MARIFDSMTQSFQGMFNAQSGNAVRMAQLDNDQARWDIQNKRSQEAHDLSMKINNHNLQQAEIKADEATGLEIADRMYGVDDTNRIETWGIIEDKLGTRINPFKEKLAKRLHPQGKSFRSVTLPDGRTGFEILKEDGTPVPMTEKRLKAGEEGAGDDNVFFVDNETFNGMLKPAFEAVASAYRESPALQAHFANTAVKASHTELPEVTQDAEDFTTSVQQNGLKNAEAEVAGKIAASPDYENFSPALKKEIETYKFNVPDFFGKGFEAAMAAGSIKPTSPKPEGELANPGLMGGIKFGTSGFIDRGHTGFDFTEGSTLGQALGGMATSAATLPAGIVGDIHQLSQKSRRAITGAVSNGLSAVGDFFNTEVAAPRPKGQEPAQMPRTGKPTQSNMVEAAPTTVTREQVEQDPVTTVQTITEQMNAGDSKTINQGKVLEQQLLRRAEPVLEDPVKRAKTAAFFVHRGIMSAAQGVAFTQTGFLDMSSMNMANAPYDRQLKVMELQIQQAEAEAKNAVASEAKYQRLATENAAVANRNTKSIEGIVSSVFGNDYAQNGQFASAPKALMDSLKFFHLGFSANGSTKDGGGFDYNPKALERFMNENVGVLQAATSRAKSIIKADGTIPMQTAMAMSLAAEMRAATGNTKGSEPKDFASIAKVLNSPDPILNLNAMELLAYSTKEGRPFNAQQIAEVAPVFNQVVNGLMQRGHAGNKNQPMTRQQAIEEANIRAYFQIYGG